VNLNRLAVLAGLATVENGALTNPYIGTRFGLAAVTTTMDIAVDEPLACWADQPKSHTHGLAWKLGKGFTKSAGNREPYAKRRFVDGAFPFEKLKRVDEPTTYIDEENVPRVPKRADLFARAQFGDLGKAVEDGSRNGLYVRKTATSAAQRKPMSAFVLLQNKEPAASVSDTTSSAQRNAENVKAACYFLGIDAVGISRCPDWAYYSHDATGTEINPTQDQAISMIVDQRFDTMDGSSGDDWISVALSMRAYLRFSLLGGVIADHIRSLGYEAKAHTATDSDVIHPPLLLLSGLGEVSRIGEVILNPYLGPRLKSGIVTTNMPMTHRQPALRDLSNYDQSGCDVWSLHENLPMEPRGPVLRGTFSVGCDELACRCASFGEIGRYGRQWRAKHRQKVVVGFGNAIGRGVSTDDKWDAGTRLAKGSENRPRRPNFGGVPSRPSTTPLSIPFPDGS